MTSVTRLQSKIPADTLGARLLLLRREMGWSQREAADRAGIPFGVWQGMESGREARALDRRILAIAAASGYDRDWLMWGGALRTQDAPNPSEPDEGSRADSQGTAGYHPCSVLRLPIAA